MRRKFRRELKNLNKAYDFPNPTREEAFFQNLEEKTKKKPLYFLILEHKAKVCQAAAVCTVVIVMAGGYGVYQNYRNGSGSIPIADVEDSIIETDMSGKTAEQTAPGNTQENLPAVDETVTETVAPVTTDLPVVSQSETEVHTSEVRQTSQQQVTAAIVQAIQSRQTTKATATTQKETRVTKETTRTSQATTMTKRTTKTTAAATTTAKPASTQTTAASTVTSTKPSGSQTTPSEEENNGAATVPPASNGEGTAASADYRVTPVYRYEKTDTIMDIGSYPVGDLPTDDVNPVIPWMIQAECSDQIVSGTVIGLTYTRIGNELWTQVDLVITEVYHGTMQQGNMISVYEKGGYIPLSEYLALRPELSSMFPMTEEEIQNTTCFDSYTQETSSSLGETCLYFLRQGSSDVPAGAYQYVSNADESRYQWDGSSLVNVLNRSDTFKKEELAAYLLR